MSNNVRDAFCYYAVGSVLQSGFIRHNWFTNENAKVGYKRAIDIAGEAYDLLKEEPVANYKQKGTLNIYPGQQLTNESKILLDMYEYLMFGNYDSKANSNTPEDLKHDLRLRFKSIETILDGYSPMIRELASNLKKAYKELGIK